MSRVNEIIKHNDRLLRERSNWNTQWQHVGEYVSQIKQNFEAALDSGEFLNDYIFDSTGTFAAKNAASALTGILWPSNAGKSIKIDPPSDMEDVTDDERRWYEEIATKRLARQMDNTKANLVLAIDEYMHDQVIFGTSGIGVFYEDGNILYKPYGVKTLVIDEGKDGRVNKCNLNMSWDVSRVVETYGIDNVSEGVRNKFESNSGEKIDIIVSYSPRNEIKEGRSGNLNMPFEAIHIEKSTKQVLKESGFEEFPILVGRFRKLLYEKYGRSMAMDAMPDIRESNALKEAVIVATDKTLDPPLGVLSDGMLGGGVVDSSAGALTVFDYSGNMGGTPPVFQISTVGDLNAALARIEALEQSIAQHFNIDRLLDFNNRTAMTATETVARSNIRNSSLVSLITRQIVELFTPLIERSFNILLRNDEFGFIQGTAEAEAAGMFGEEVEIIPDRIAQRLLNGLDAYSIRYTTPADRITNADELDGMIQMIQLNQQLMQTHPQAGNYLDVSKIQSNGIRLFGAPSDIIMSDEEVEEIEIQQAEAAQAQQQLDQAQQLAGIASDVQQTAQ